MLYAKHPLCDKRAALKPFAAEKRSFIHDRNHGNSDSAYAQSNAQRDLYHTKNQFKAKQYADRNEDEIRDDPLRDSRRHFSAIFTHYFLPRAAKAAQSYCTALSRPRQPLYARA